MALTSEDIWQKFDLFNSEKLDLSKLDIDDSDPSLMSVTSTAMNKKTGEHDNFKVPDIMDILSDFSLGINFMDGAVDMDYNSFLDDILGMEMKDPLRHDCMWSGQCPSEEHQPVVQKHVKPVSEPTAPSSNLNFDLSSKTLSCFDTPLSSETSDLDETSSDIDDADTTSSNSRLQPPVNSQEVKSALDFTFSDHCYVATSNSAGSNFTTFPASSSKERTARFVNNAKSTGSSTFRIPSFPCTTTATAVRYKRSSLDGMQMTGRQTTVSPAKFKFHMKFKKSTSLPGSRSVLRQPSKLQKRTTKPLNTVQASHQMNPTRVLSSLDDNRKLSSDDDTKRWSKAGSGGNCRDVRYMHNILERQRRVDLKIAFDTLKSVVPDLRSSEKASKLLILTKATDYCRGLVTTEGHLRKNIESQKLRRQALMRKLRSMQSAS